jgi:hypothetical protein
MVSVMYKATALGILVLSNAAFGQSSQSDAMAAADRLKKAHVERTVEECTLRGGTKERCDKILGLIHKRELAVLGRLSPALADPKVNVNQLNAEMTACYDPSSDYTDLVRCWEMLADRLDAARSGQFLLKR